MRRTHYCLALCSLLSLTVWSCAQSKQEPSTLKIDSTPKYDSARAALAAKEGTFAAAVADSVALAAESAKKAMEEKADEVNEAVKKAHPAAYDPTPVDKEPETDMESLKKAIVYPKEAKDKGIEGRVRVRALVGSSGRVAQAFIENSTNTIFDEPAQTAVKRAKFTPAMNNGKRIQRWVSVPVIYRLL